ncbi:MAG TPA: hypothetical protein VGO50_20605 [Pyrinomonadaceae bacterium]|jgi:hypothetical protein|nr:hypothetical protein [Pyrinomonadaceae bacterium]
MKNRLIVWGLILATSIIVLPAASLAASEKTNSSIANYEYSATSAPQTRGRGRGRGRDDNKWNNGRRGRHHAKHKSHGTRTVRQVYYRNGRRYVRNVRVHY